MCGQRRYLYDTRIHTRVTSNFKGGKLLSYVEKVSSVHALDTCVPRFSLCTEEEELTKALKGRWPEERPRKKRGQRRIAMTVCQWCTVESRRRSSCLLCTYVYRPLLLLRRKRKKKPFRTLGKNRGQRGGVGRRRIVAVCMMQIRMTNSLSPWTIDFAHVTTDVLREHKGIFLIFGRSTSPRSTPLTRWTLRFAPPETWRCTTRTGQGCTRGPGLSRR